MKLKVDLSKINDGVVVPIETLISDINGNIESLQSVIIPSNFQYHAELVDINENLKKYVRNLVNTKFFVENSRDTLIRIGDQFSNDLTNIANDVILKVDNRVKK